jgi:O-methyltransferase
MPHLFKYVKALQLFLLPKRHIGDKIFAFNIVTKIAQRILPIYRFTYPQMDWWKNVEFNDFLRNFDELRHHNTHRKWLLKQLLRLSAHVPGDTAECGVYMGASSWLILKSNSLEPLLKMHHIFDSFEGLSDPKDVDGGYWATGDMSVDMSHVVKYLLPFVNNSHYKLYKGWIPTRFEDVRHLKFSFVHVDVDLYQPTFDSLSFFYKLLSPGGVFLCDDYGFDTCPGATKAIDDYLLDKIEKMISLPDGGGFFIKGVPVASMK